MSNTDSFIEEVNEELRRDRLFGYMRRYGWIAAILIAALVGGTAWNEYRKAQVSAAAEARGDAIMEALRLPTAEERAATMVELAPSGVVEAFLAATELNAAGDIAAASEVLNTVSETADLSPLYRDLAQIRRLTIDTEMAPDERALLLERLSAPGAPYRTIAEEYQALDLIAAGDRDAALEALQSILQDADSSGAQRSRVSQLVIALGGTPELANALLNGSGLTPSE